MLKVQEYLQTRTLDQLKDEFAIKVKEHDVYPLVILNYNQIDSPKLNPITMECRGLILEKDTWRIIAKGFTRFFNFGEALEVTNNFDWTNPIECYDKEDGSYINIFWYGDPTAPRPQWRMSTRGSFGMDELVGTNGNRWLDLVHGLLPDTFYRYAHRQVNYVFELTSPYNKVVRHYREAKLVLLTATHVLDNGDVYEFNHKWLNKEAERFEFKRPEFRTVTNIVDVEHLLRARETDDPTFEGFVLKDRHGMRLKVKTQTYMALHRLRGEGDNMYDPKNIVPLVLAGEGEEILTYFPEIKDTWDKISSEINTAYNKLYAVWFMCKDYNDQKAFALYITKENPTPFSGILFRMKQQGVLYQEACLKAAWRDSCDSILKHVFGK